MHQQIAVLEPITVPVCVSLAHAEIEQALAYAEMEKSEGTRRAYRSDFAIFTAWCDERDLVAMPAAPSTVARFLSSQATGGLKSSTIGRRGAAIAYAHKLAGHEPPGNAESVRAVVRGIRRSVGTVKVQKAPATADLIRRMLDACSDTMRGKRDRALLALGFAMAARRSELVALTVADLAEVPDGYRVTIRYSKTDQEGAGQTIAVPRGSRLRPVEAVQIWLAASGITEGPVFRTVNRGGRVGEVLGAGAVRAVVKEYATRVGLDSALFSAHSLRSGFCTSGAEAGASVFKLMEVSRHRSVDVLRGYVRRSDMFRDHAGSSFL